MPQDSIDLNHLSPEINSLLESLTKFETTLSREHDALKESNTNNLIEIISLKEELSKKIETTLSNLAKITKDHNFSIDHFLQSKHFDLLPISLQEKVKSIGLKVVSCHEKNTTNGISLQALKNLNQNLLQLFKVNNTDNKTYTSSGNSTANKSISRPLGKA